MPARVVNSPHLRVAASAALLALATYAYAGYAYGVWPQPGLLEYVLRLNGSLQGDWMMSLTPPHWAIANLLGLGPVDALDEEVLFLWIAGLLVFWLGAGALATRLGVSFLGMLGAGCILIPTSLSALGSSQALNVYLYPIGLAFAIGVGGLALVVLQRPGAAGLAMGVATAVHPNLGGLLMLAVLPGVVAGDTSRTRRIGRYLGGFGLVAVVPLAVLAGKLDRGDVSAREQYDLAVRVRNPHHQLYETFPATEYRQTTLWLIVLGISLYVVRRQRTARQIALVGAAAVAIAGVGAVASMVGGPKTLVMAQTARITPLIVLLASISAAAALTTLQRHLAAPLLFTVFVIAALPSVRRQLGVSSTEALFLLVALGTSALARDLGGRRFVRVAQVLTLSSAVAVIAVLDARDPSPGTLSAHDRAWRSVAKAATAASGPEDLFLVPPDQDGFRFYSHRPIVIDFGSFPFGRGIREWSDRMIAVTGTRRIVDPDLGDALERVAFMAESYDAALRRSPAAVCRYGVTYVVGRGSRAPPWLRAVYRNAVFSLYRVRRDACQ